IEEIPNSNNTIIVCTDDGLSHLIIAKIDGSGNVLDTIHISSLHFVIDWADIYITNTNEYTIFHTFNMAPGWSQEYVRIDSNLNILPDTIINNIITREWYLNLDNFFLG